MVGYIGIKSELHYVSFMQVYTQVDLQVDWLSNKQTKAKVSLYCCIF